MRLPTVIGALVLLTALGGCVSAGEPAPVVPIDPATPPAVPPPAEAETPPADDQALASVRQDVETVAVSLESFYRGNPYPEDVDTVIGTLEDAGLTLSPGNTIGSYVYDADAVEFTLCVEDEAGAWATYDTAPMTLREAGESGGCP